MNYDVTSSTEPILLPKAVRFVKKKQLPFIEYRYTITPSTGDGTYSSSGQIIYQPKLPKNTFKCVYGPASYHSCLLTMTATNGAYLDSSANCVINQVVEMGQDTVSDFRNSNVYMNMQLDFTIDPTTRRNFWSFFGCGNTIQTNANSIYTAGTSTGGTTQANLRSYWSTNLALGTQLRAILDVDFTNSTLRKAAADGIADYMWAGVQEMNRTSPYFNNSQGDYLANGGTAYYAQVIPGSVIGALQTRLFPLSELNNGYSLTFNLETFTNAFIGDQTAYTLKSNRLHMCVIEFNEALSGLMRSAFQNVFTIPTSGITNVTTQFTNTQQYGATLTWQVPIALTNAKGIIFCFRGADQFAAGYATLSQRAKLGCSNYQLQVGSRTLPANRWVELNNYATNQGADAEGFMETCKYFNNTISNNSYGGCVNYQSFNNNLVSAATATKYLPAHFCIGYNLDGILEQTDEYRSCTQLESNTTFLTAKFTTGTDQAVYVDCFVLYEMDLVIVEGGLTVQNKLNAFASGMPY